MNQNVRKIAQPLRRGLLRVLRAIGQIRPLVPVLYDPRVSRVLQRMPGAGALYGYGWHRRHPYDRANGTDTSGIVVPRRPPKMIALMGTPFGFSQSGSIVGHCDAGAVKRAFG